MDTLFSALIWLIPVLLSLSVHEWAHAASAYRLGDDTAARLGRMTLNPLAHIDPVGTILLPALQLVSTQAIYFAWARPVPVNPARFARGVSTSTGNVLVSAAGPASNLALALISAVLLGLGYRHGWGEGAGVAFLQAMLVINVVLAVFNLLPVPPLDGSKVLHGLLPRRAAAAYEQIFPYAPFLLLAVIFFGRNLIFGPIQVLQGWMYGIARAIVG